MTYSNHIIKFSYEESIVVDKPALITYSRPDVSLRNYKHGLAKSRIYRTWTHIKTRCLNTKSPDYVRYGGRGINICNEWRDEFMCFYNWSMENGYKETLSIDRIDVNGNYEPENCRWLTMDEQARNKRNNKLLKIHGNTKCLSELSREVGIHHTTILKRLKLHWTEEKALTTPVKKRLDLIMYKDEKKQVSEFAREYSLSHQCLNARLKRGWSVEMALITPKRKQSNPTRRLSNVHTPL